MILVLSGTSVGRKVADALSRKYKVLVSTKTEYGKKLINENKNLKAVYGELDRESLKSLILKNNIKVIVDATHPFATIISKIAFSVSKELNVDYIRYLEEEEKVSYENAVYVENHNQAKEKCHDFENIFLTIGTKDLAVYKDLIDSKNVFVRVLPTLDSIKICEDLNILPKNIIAMQGPFSKELNYILFKETEAQVVVTKESNLFEKVEAAKRLGIHLIIVKRPKEVGRKKVSSIDELMRVIKDAE
ncbi:precorrin-6x reductase [Thermosipho africanus TCF52B]|uniref:Precorrin-6x reductase n=1 Tax=Thermosipho africanus (strain TCF52B) TaxID=484019 RepID=B7IHG7_THEAB|nr:precorrin-6A reductase [Thermosipho africanus]ACJ75531.1 precorrin-6x reductase [Thermosipho africanus TCF52B]